MRYSHVVRWSALAVLGLVALAASEASATFHTWQISEIYSNASGTVQFIQMHESLGFDFQGFLAGHTFTTNAYTFTFAANLPGTSTANKYFLLATLGYAALPGAVQPDYTIPANFFSTSGDTLNYAGVDAFTFTAGQLPADGVHALDRSKAVAMNQETSFAGASGSVVPEPSSLAVMIEGMALFSGLIYRRFLRS